ncbi:CRIB domain-containing protein RIC7 [Momordica charantia]|uniref:CRIB domain-containing protein RIC7 n=1 Tax=Momordica charantia TaxID=3673 RepID=A0A6J1DMX0_MOMCH|nr:CRIB domain-containing protein RIC7 [Momordica charantia]XP_022155609.1 CRIB domain-containing protein RIC7 [Momordica charantia]XP_022155610.1 CRIB domain-containing protein RIC7 [Momordica charantia]
MSNNKMKGLLKGLRYISQIFDNEKEPEMQIGFPTDVKHVAHIGWDGPSVNNNPSWMNEFKAPPPNGETNEDASVQWASQGGDSKRDMAVTTRDMPELPKSSRRQSSTVGGSAAESPTREKSEKPKSRKSSKSKESSRRSADLNQGGESPTQGAPGIPKKTRRKKSKDSAGEGSTRSTCKAADTCSDNGSDQGSIAGSISRSNDEDLLTGDGVFA